MNGTIKIALLALAGVALGVFLSGAWNGYNSQS
jgi:hypothetical protein